eukprot:TRINITY_DN44750_c0_g1_i1.p1 TRINITY_DN44750_c0_g1~~TRINITY_DN44750_c0_g1_i1.p1  ORF type:complete len:786 (+),score=220.62 TRINITY_DN44750_c0_g1_i1:140-2497(+)
MALSEASGGADSRHGSFSMPRQMSPFASGPRAHSGAQMAGTTRTVTLPSDTVLAGSEGPVLAAAADSAPNPKLEEEVARLKQLLEEAERRNQTADEGVGKRFANALHLDVVGKGVGKVGDAAGGIAKALHLDDAARKLHLDDAAGAAARMLHIPLSSGPPTLLFVTVLRGHSLAAADRKKKRSSPFCVVELVDGQRKGLEKDRRRQKTHVIERTLEPAWGERLLTLPLAPGVVVGLRVQVYSTGILSDDFLGEGELLLEPEEVAGLLPAPRTVHVKLGPRLGQKRDQQLAAENGGSLGEVSLQLRSGYPEKQAPRAAPGVPASLEVHLMGATDLRGPKKMQTFAEIAVRGCVGLGGARTGAPRRTRTQVGQEPDFDDRFTYDLTDPDCGPALCDITMFDKRGGSDGDVPVGQGTVTLRPEDLLKALNCPVKRIVVLKPPDHKAAGLEKVTRLLPLKGMLQKGCGQAIVAVRTATVPAEYAQQDTDLGRPGGVPQEEEEEQVKKTRQLSQQQQLGPPPEAPPQWQPWVPPDAGGAAAPPWVPPAAAAAAAPPWAPAAQDAQDLYPHQEWCTGLCGGMCNGPPPGSRLGSPPPLDLATGAEEVAEFDLTAAAPPPADRTPTASEGGFSSSSEDLPPRPRAGSSVASTPGPGEVVPTLRLARVPEEPPAAGAGRGRRHPGAARGPPPLSMPAPKNVDVQHDGEWRGEGFAQCCSTKQAPEGRLCVHEGGAVPHPHWSCCGSTARSGSCATRSGFFEEMVATGQRAADNAITAPLRVPPSVQSPGRAAP